MKKFMDSNFLLNNNTAEKLYHNYAKHMPIFDYHCHINPQEIADNKQYKNITEIWLGGDHYKWRAMRINGIDEKYITGDAPDKEKFFKWAETIEKCIGNPLYHWTHLELKRYFGIDSVLTSKTAEEIWNKCNTLLNTKEFTTRSLINKSNVKVICTTDDLLDSLQYHKQIAEDTSFEIKVLPALRPDKCFNIEKDTFLPWVNNLNNTVGYEISTFQNFLSAIEKRIVFFHKAGCRISDHALDPIVFEECTMFEADIIFKKALNRVKLTNSEIAKFKTKVLLFLGRQYSKLDWAMQLHLSCLRNSNSNMLNILGPDTGFDCMADNNIARNLIMFLDSINKTNELPKTILYSLNSKDNDVISSIIGCFQGNSIPSKIQFGSAWWFNDHKEGMKKQMTSLANMGLLSRFIGMLTDSRSFLSYTRHEYFRRILCNLIGEWVENGEFSYDIELLGSLVEDICYNNAVDYFGI